MSTGNNIKDFKEKLKAIEEKNKPLQDSKFSHEQLMKALYYMFDAFDRANIKFFLTGKTAKACYENKGLSSDKVEIGIRKLEYVSGAWRVLTEFAKPVKEEEEMIHFEHEGVPIECRLFDEDVFFNQAQPILWQYEGFNLPNPYEEYVKRYETKKEIDN